MNKRTINKLKALVIGILIIIGVLFAVHVFSNNLIPWIIKMHS
ncbi:MAG: hypothetical protein K0R92_1339 [Lachnospiraceae bacterium]|jgi:hypothetical protein|nr:hypothetical protein [Lachnospiraceae bacterium]